jgi:hypothetical protein
LRAKATAAGSTSKRYAGAPPGIQAKSISVAVTAAMQRVTEGVIEKVEDRYVEQRIFRRLTLN